jgi:uncharacterized protein (DUF58 family)
MNEVGDPRKFLDPRTLAKLHGLRLRARHIVEGYVAGLHRSPLRGFSIEFAEHRKYVPGDDLRQLDWKAFGRTDKFYLKQYEDETNLICYLVLDISQSMHYQGAEAALSKLAYAQLIAASLAWLVLHQQDAVGLATFDQDIEALLRPSTSPPHLREIIRVLESASTGTGTAIGPVLHELAERLSKRGVVVILSDLLDDIPSLMAGLGHFRHRQHDVVVFHILDPAELDFPFHEPTRFHGLERARQVMTDPRSVRRAYLKEFGNYLTHVKNGCRSQAVSYQLIRTDQPLDRALSHFLGTRMAKVR